MCGFAAIIAPQGDATLRMIRGMSDAARHRGPDDEGFVLFGTDGLAPSRLGGPDTPGHAYASPYPYAPERRAEDTAAGGSAVVAMGHRRLSILDVSPAGHQPLCYGGGRYWIVYNGEVYNFVELREELEVLGHRFHSRTDTEVILAAYAQWGSDALSRLNGMFAFAIYDSERRRLVVARDRFGIKPLYWWTSPEGHVAFASEIKQFAALPGWNPRLNAQRAYDFLNWRITDHTAETLFDGVMQLRGGEVLELDVDAPVVQPRSWYTLRPAPFDGSFEEASARFRELFVDAVRLRLRSDVPVGSCLSGGLDSSSIVCSMAELLAGTPGAVQKTFSACAHEARFDERRYIDEVVALTSVEPHYVYPDVDSLFAVLDRLSWHQDEPVSTTSVFAQWEVFRIASENGIKVMLDGQGADEQLAGYHTFFAPRLAGLFLSMQWRTMVEEVRALERLHGYSAMHAAQHTLNMLLPRPLRAVGRRLAARTATAPGWLDMDRLGATPGNPFEERGSATSDVAALSVLQLTSTNLQMLLHWEDRDSMAHSVESRVPFLDYRLVEFVLGLPVEFKIAGGITKRVLREGMSGILPESVRGRMDKMGFVTPEELWLRRDAPDRFRSLVASSSEETGGIIRPGVAAAVQQMVDGRTPFEPLAWRVISFAAWMRTFGVTGGAQ
jgi:asparagine synthase (glutamine-hydrolysing)